MYRPSLSLGKTCFNKSLLGISSRISILLHLHYHFDLTEMVLQKQFIKNCEGGNELSSFVSKKRDNNMFHNKLFQVFKFVCKWVNIYIADDNLIYISQP